MQQTFNTENQPQAGAQRDEAKVQQAEQERIQKNQQAAAEGKPQEGGAAGRQGVASKDPADFDTRSGHAGGVEPQSKPLV